MVKHLCISALLKRVYWADVNKDGTMRNDKIDVTEQFLNCAVNYFNVNTITTLTDHESNENKMVVIIDKPDLIEKINLVVKDYQESRGLRF